MVTHHRDHFIIVSNLTCWSLLFLRLSNSTLKLFQLHVPPKPNQNTLTTQPDRPQLLPHIKYNHNQGAPCQIPPLQSQLKPCVVSNIADCQPSSLLPSQHQIPFKVFQGTYQSCGSLFSFRQTAHFRHHHSCPELQSQAPGSRSVK